MPEAGTSIQGWDAGPVVFFDGVCGLCNASVDFLLTRDSRGQLKFGPLQGETARRVLGSEAESLESLVLVDRGRAFRESEGVLRAVVVLGGGWGLMARVLLWVPQGIRNLVYRWVARHRYQWFGKRATCRLPTAQEASRFLN